MEIFGLIKNSADNDTDKQTTRKRGASGVVNRGVGVRPVLQFSRHVFPPEKGGRRRPVQN